MADIVISSDVLLIITIFVAVLVPIVLYPKIRKNKTKQQAEKELNELYTTTIAEQKMRIKQLQGAVNRLKGTQDDEEEESQPDLSKDPMVLKTIAQRFNIPEALLHTKEAQKLIKQYLPLAQQYGLLNQANQSNPNSQIPFV